MPARKFDLIVEQGADYGPLTVPVLQPDGQPQSLTGWTASGQVRAGYSSTTILHTLDLTLAGSSIVLRIPAATSTAWDWSLGRYDVEVQAPDGTRTRLVEGSVVVRAEITRSA